MKKLAMCIVVAALLSGCCGNAELKRVAQGEPILPIREAGDTTEVYLTDYLPSVDLQQLGDVRVTEGYDSLVVNGEVATLYGAAGKLGVLSVGKGCCEVNIPILPKLPVVQGLTTAGINDGQLLLQVDEAQQPLVFRCFVQNVLLPEDAVKQQEGATYSIDLNSLPKQEGRSFLRVFACNDSVLLNDLLIPLENGKPVTDAKELTRHDANAQILYSLLVDRFNNGNTGNDAPLNIPDVDERVDYKGGDLKGITAKIQDGFFDSLGINTLWISPITQNPKDAWGQYDDPKTKFSGYHGYWPIYNTKIDDRMGTDAELKDLLATAHEHGINVILDYVANHMHINSPTLKAHPDWITDSILPDGRRNFELWDEARLTTWFDKHIPTLDLERKEVCEAMTDTALYWVDKYDFDGYRHDACKHIPLDYWRMFTRKMKSRYPDRSLWMIGETYGDNELIGSYVKTGMLNAQFDFNIYHTAIDVLGRKDISMKRLAKTIDESLASYGAHHTMGNISGNHDKTRFISLAGGAVSWDEDGKAAGWHRQIGVTADIDPERESIAFKKALLLEVINLTIPGVPCIYQGDEYGQCGANDPDNRRMMRFSGLTDNEQRLLAQTKYLTHLRRSSMPLLYGDYRQLYVDDHVLIFSRTYMGQEVIVALNNGAEPFSIELQGKQIDIPAYGYLIFNP
jgi:glycosidase